MIRVYRERLSGTPPTVAYYVVVDEASWPFGILVYYRISRWWLFARTTGPAEARCIDVRTEGDLIAARVRRVTVPSWLRRELRELAARVIRVGPANAHRLVSC